MVIGLSNNTTEIIRRHSNRLRLRIAEIFNHTTQRWTGPQLVPLCAFPQLEQQGNLLRMCVLIRRQLTAELRLRTKKYSCGPYFHYAQYRNRDRENILSFSVCQWTESYPYPPHAVCLPAVLDKERHMHKLHSS
jgi:hypothetical protein